MRDQLRALENQLVFIQGNISSYSNRNGHKYVCLFRPTVIPWDGQSSFFDAEKQGKITGLDHLWVRHSDSYDRVEMYKKVMSCSRIRWYARKDNSIDLGAEPLHVLWDHDSQIQRQTRAKVEGYFGKNWGHSITDEHIKCADFYLDLLENQGRVNEHGKPEWIFSVHKSIPWLIDFHTNYREEMREAIKKFDVAQVKVQEQVKRGRCRSAGGFADLLK
tara:strand:+ start:1402 stop:2055 length:654 start_codon:yes stop_codon:yes gene_type:complete